MAKFHYEWWTIKMRLTCGICKCQFKGKNKEHVIHQIKKDVDNTNSGKKGYCPQVIEVYWNTLQLDRIGYQRLS